MLVRRSSWSCDGYRCLCACSLRLLCICLSALPSIPSLWNSKLIIFHQFIITRSVEGAKPNVGVNLGHTEMPNRRTLIRKASAVFHFSALSVMVLCLLISVLTNCGFISTLYLRPKSNKLELTSNSFKLIQTQHIPQCVGDIIYFDCHYNYFGWTIYCPRKNCERYYCHFNPF